MQVRGDHRLSARAEKPEPIRANASGRRPAAHDERRASGRGRERGPGCDSAAPDRVERYGSRATVSFESLHIRIPLKFCQNSAKLSQFSEILKILGLLNIF